MDPLQRMLDRIESVTEARSATVREFEPAGATEEQWRDHLSSMAHAEDDIAWHWGAVSATELPHGPAGTRGPWRGQSTLAMAARWGEQMPRTREQLEQAAAEATQWLDELDPDDPSVTVEVAADLRAVGLALAAIAASETNLAATVAAARANGRSWARIAAVLGVSKQAAMSRFGSAGLQRS